jgi:hypothetical protein
MSLADSSKTNHKPCRSQPSLPYHDLAQTSVSIYDQNTTIIPQDERLWLNSHLAGWKTRATHSSLSPKITWHKTTQHLARWKTWIRTPHNSLSRKITYHKSSQHLARWKTWIRNQHNSLSRKITYHKSARHLTRWMTWTKTYLKSRLWLNSKTKTAGLSKAIVPICKPTSKVQIQQGKLEDRRKRPEGGWMRANQNSSQELYLYHRINPMPLSSNSIKTA